VQILVSSNKSPQFNKRNYGITLFKLSRFVCCLSQKAHHVRYLTFLFCWIKKHWIKSFRGHVENYIWKQGNLELTRRTTVISENKTKWIICRPTKLTFQQASPSYDQRTCCVYDVKCCWHRR